MSLREELRKKALSKRYFRRDSVQVTFPGDTEPTLVEVIQPTTRERAAILEAGGVSAKKDAKGSLADLQVAAVIACTVVPGTEERVFEPADREALLAAPAGGWLDDLSNAAMRLLDVDTKELEKK